MPGARTALRGIIVGTLASAALMGQGCGLDEGGSPANDGGVTILDALSEPVDVGPDVGSDGPNNQDAGPDAAADADAFTPASLSGLDLWLEADQGVLADAGSVLEWRDQSNKKDPARNATPGTFGAPTVVDAGFGPALFFGSTGGLQTGKWDGGLTDPSSVFMVAGRDPVSVPAYLFDSLDPALQHGALVGSNNLISEYAGVLGSPAMGAVSKPMTIVAVFNGASSFILRSANRGDAGVSSPGPNNSIAGFTIGNYPGNGYGLGGYIAEFAVYSRVLTDGEIASLNAYAAQRYGIAIQ